MRKVKIIAALLAVFILGLTSCVQKPCPTYTKADVEQKKQKQGRW